ncbi:uncharacterized protein K452DRAFT_285600 [Aplosporella prunicola CBS 121167]|uniref:ATPase synthesis protein 25 n=1 Tax=Aplosporella prunicola CBS 121167 TaxID=1176127 RepID=A0A6A6BJU0_9PEZI|nr:uncharacterized protein K452DRAFT_285600 [Aplosporella prunicola CBS 121167]KAF2143554.1 hypothetical protein K452DRAFT_285600 [Aplosporella prunicola CBS 121167]
MASACRRFASLAAPCRPLPVRSLFPTPPHRRALATSVPRLSDQLSRDELEDPFDESVEEVDETLKSNEPASDTSLASIPWYLQHDQAQQHAVNASPISERQRLPDLPEHAPPMLQPMMQHASVDLGIDDITLFDLRHLDPPPALGANLIQLFGTARSEKHLHVSADKLCRWLRSQYKLSPHADGLLGRGELKIKLRRKARKTRMLSNAGAAEGSLAADDGIRTGWICVNAGRVEAAESAKTEDEPEGEGFVGFGTRSHGVNVVFQLFTEEKRAELDLEGLWNGVLKTDARRKEAMAAGMAVNDPHGHVTYNSNGAVFANQSVAAADPRAPLQTRALHSSSRATRRDGMNMALLRAGEYGVANGLFRVGKAGKSMSMSMSTEAEAATGKTATEPTSTGNNNKKSYTPEEQSKTFASLFAQLEQMTPSEKMAALGKGAQTRPRGHTAFLRQFYALMPPSPLIPHYDALLRLYEHALALAHPGYPLRLVAALFDEMQIASLHIPRPVFLAGLRLLCTSHCVADPDRDQLILALLEAMRNHGQAIKTADVLVQVHDALSAPQPALDADTHSISEADHARARLLATIELGNVPLSRPAWIRLLSAAATARDLAALWHIWNNMPLDGVTARGPGLYALVLRAQAAHGDMDGTVQALRQLVPEMKREVPPVRLVGEVADAVRLCLGVVEPGIERLVGRGVSSGEWVELWLRCVEEEEREGAWEGRWGLGSGRGAREGREMHERRPEDGIGGAAGGWL